MTASPNAFWPSVSVATSALFWGTTWMPLREIVRGGLPQSWSGVLIYAVPALIALDRLAAVDKTKPTRAANLVYALSALIAILGGYWFLTRALDT